MRILRGLALVFALLLLPPAVGFATESANDATVTTVGPTLTDASGNVFAINTSSQVVINGVAETGTSNVIELAYVNHVLWQENSVGSWYNYLGTPGSYGGPSASPLAVSGGGKTSPPTPLTGSVVPQTWVAYDQSFSGVTLTSGLPFHFNVLPPAQYNPTAYKYPLHIWLHPDGSGNNWYNGSSIGSGGSQSNPFFYIPNEPANFNTVSFLTNYPAVTVVPYADQTCSQGSAVCNWGGWTNNGTTGSGTNFSGDTGPNTFALLAMITFLEANYSIDPNRIYVDGFSLGGIGSEYLMLKYNAYNGAQKIFAAGVSTGGVMEINGFGAGPTSGNATTMANVPVWWFSGANDGTSIPADWNLPMWRLLANNSSYPSAITSPAANQAGSSQMHFTLCPTCGHQSTDSAGNPVSVNPIIDNWMFGTSAAVAVVTPPTGQFSISGGAITDPSGQPFIPAGVNVYGDAQDLAATAQNAAGFPILSVFPKLNFVRVIVFPTYHDNNTWSYQAPNDPSFVSFVNNLTAHGVVVEFEDHSSNGGFWEQGIPGGLGAVQANPPTGSALAQNVAFWASMATQYKSNPYVWFGDLNEINTASYNTADIGAISTYQLALYNAIRGTGNTNIILLGAGNGNGNPGTSGVGSGLIVADYAVMHNVLWHMHRYVSGTDASVLAAVQGSTAAPCCGGGGSQGYRGAQTIPSADGVMPVIIDEGGSGTTADPNSTTGQQMADAMITAQSDNIGAALFVYFNPNGVADWTMVNNGGTAGLPLSSYSFTPWGNIYSAVINANPKRGATNITTVSTETLTVNALQTTTANTGFAVSGSILNATGTPTLQYQNNNGAWTALPSGAQVSSVAFSFTDPGMTTPGVGNNTVSVRDANATTITATSNNFTVTGAESVNDSVVTASLTAATFSDNFTSLSLHNTWQAGDNWQLVSPDTPAGRGGPNFGENGDQWWVNPFNTSTPIGGIYTQDTGGLHLGLITTPSAQQAYITTQAGAALPYVGGLLNTSQTNYQKYGYWQITAAVPKVNGFTFQADIENVQITGTFPPEIDLRIGTNASGVQTVLFEFALGGGVYTKFTMPGTFDPTQSHTYAWDWESDFITFYVDGVQQFQSANPSTAYQTAPMFLFLVTAANYIANTGDPAAASLPVSANVTSVNIYPTKPAAISSGSLVDATGEVWTITPGGQVAVNGVADTTTSNVVELAYVNHAVWYETGAGLWRFKTQASDTWQPVAGTTTAPLVSNESPNNTVVTTVGPQIIDSHNSTFSISSGGQILINGVAETGTSNVIELAYVNHVLWQENSVGSWYNYLGTPGSYGGPTTTSPLTVESIVVNTIAAQLTGAGFTVTGGITNVTIAPTLQYQDNTGAWTAFPTGSTVSTTSYSFIHPGMVASPTNTINVRDANNTSAVGSSNGFAVTSTTGENLSINPVAAQTANVTFTVTGTLTGVTGSGSGNSGTPPAPAAAVGFNTLTYGPTILLGATGGGAADPVTGWPAFTGGVNWAPFTFYGTGWRSIGAVQNSDGSVTLDGTGEAFGNGLSTANPPVNGVFAGQTFGNGGYFEANMKSTGPFAFWANDFESMGYAAQGDLTKRQWPGQAAGYGDWIETDMSEFDSTGVYGGAMHNWYAGNICSGNSFSINSLNPPGNQACGINTLGSGSSFNQSPTNCCAGADFTQYHNYGFLWKPATSTTQGYAKWFFDRQQVGNTITWNQYNPALAPPPVDNGTGGSSAYSVLDVRHLALILGGSPGATNTISGVQVWQTDGSGDLPVITPGSGTGAPTLQYQDNGGAWQVLPAGFTVTNTTFSFAHPGATVGTLTLSVRDANNPTVIGTATVTVNAVVGGSITGWNPTDTSSTITLANSNQLATSTASVEGGTRAVTPQSTGKFCFETLPNTMTPFTSVGISNASFALAGILHLGADTNSIGYLAAQPGSLQSIWYANVQVILPTSTADVSGNPITFCEDLTAQKEWVSTPVMRATSGVIWNNTTLANANPATGVGGASFSGLICPCYPTMSTLNVGAQVTLNTTGPFALTLPAGFLAWQPASVILHHPFLFNFGQLEPANDNADYVPVRFERAVR